MDKDEADQLKRQLKDTMLTNLARLHTYGDDPGDKRYEQLLKELYELYEDIHARLTLPLSPGHPH